uniref:Uncharacterized protein n=1 Tax=viral metagenome TaxID=1070528 RepID=A0A6C0EJT7_9ZZZZ
MALYILINIFYFIYNKFSKTSHSKQTNINPNPNIPIICMN